MATMTIRTTVAFDPATAQRLERLAKRWGLSKSETLRRALEAAERDLAIDVKTKSDFSKMTPGQALQWLHSHPTHPPGTGNRWSREIRKQRVADALRERSRRRAD
jgi:hypothetical protein